MKCWVVGLVRVAWGVTNDEKCRAIGEIAPMEAREDRVDEQIRKTIV